MMGLDVSTSSVKLVELGQTASGDLVLERLASEPFEKGWIVDGQIEKFDEVADAVRRVVARSGSRNRQVVLAMPAASVITKRIVLPAGLREEEMEVQVEAEEVSRAFTSMVTYKTVSKVVRATDGEAEKKGTVVKTEGYRCKATSFSIVNPGTAGEYNKVKWKCTFQAADTPTQITLTYKQSSL